MRERINREVKLKCKGSVLELLLNNYNLKFRRPRKSKKDMGCRLPKTASQLSKVLK